MDVDFWAARVHSSKNHHSARLNTADSHGIIEEGGDDIQAWFPCPFCYIEIEVPVFCTHLQEYHCFDVKNSVCPICAATLGKDAIGHFTLHHANSVKRRRNSSSTVQKHLREVMNFDGTNLLSKRCDERERDQGAADSLISPFICSVACTDSSDNQDDVSFSNGLLTPEKSSHIPPFLDPIQESEYKERKERASFLQELIFSTIF